MSKKEKSHSKSDSKYHQPFLAAISCGNTNCKHNFCDRCTLQYNAMVVLDIEGKCSSFAPGVHDFYNDNGISLEIYGECRHCGRTGSVSPSSLLCIVCELIEERKEE